jgi:hypothetical protein
MKNYLLVALLLAFLFAHQSCRKTTEERESFGNEYFPMKIGTVKFYQVDSFFFNAFFNTTDSVKQVIKEEVKEKLLNQYNDTIYRIELSRFNTQYSKWVVFKTFSRYIKDNMAIEDFDNIKEVKHLFPITTYKTRGSSYIWNMNMFNNKEAQFIKYAKVFTSYSVDNETYPNTVTILLNRPLKGLVNDIREEIYAKDVGLIYKHIDNSDYTSYSDTLKRSGFEVFIRLKK